MYRTTRIAALLSGELVLLFQVAAADRLDIVDTRSAATSDGHGDLIGHAGITSRTGAGETWTVEAAQMVSFQLAALS